MPLNNFGVIEISKGMLARGAQPDKSACDALMHVGVNVLYKLNTDSEYSDKTEISNFTGKVVLDPYPPLFEIPNKEAILKTVSTIKQLLDSDLNVMVHCTHGTDRTGLVIGTYRIIYDGWSFDEVQVERDIFGASALRDIIDAKIVEFLKQLSNEKR